MAHEYWFEHQDFDSNPWSLLWRVRASTMSFLDKFIEASYTNSYWHLVRRNSLSCSKVELITVEFSFTVERITLLYKFWKIPLLHFLGMQFWGVQGSNALGNFDWLQDHPMRGFSRASSTTLNSPNVFHNSQIWPNNPITMTRVLRWYKQAKFHKQGTK